jgi:hypothetical protein
VGYSGLDPIEIPRILLDALPSFDGRPTAEVLRRVERDLGIRIEDDLVRRLTDLSLLEAVD